MSRTVTTTGTPSFSTSLTIYGQSEVTPEFQDLTNAQKLLDNDLNLYNRTNPFLYYSTTVSTNSTWSFSGSDTIAAYNVLDLVAGANVTFQLNNTGAGVSANWMTIKTRASAYTITILNASGSTIATMAANTSCEFVYTGSQWVLWSTSSL